MAFTAAARRAITPRRRLSKTMPCLIADKQASMRYSRRYAIGLCECHRIMRQFHIVSAQHAAKKTYATVFVFIAQPFSEGARRCRARTARESCLQRCSPDARESLRGRSMRACGARFSFMLRLARTLRPPPPLPLRRVLRRRRENTTHDALRACL